MFEGTLIMESLAIGACVGRGPGWIRRLLDAPVALDRLEALWCITRCHT
jgi:hypothetical protein